MIWDGLFTNDHRRNKWDLYWLGTSWSQYRLLAGQNSIGYCCTSMVYLYLISASNNPMLFVMERQGFSQNKTEPDTVLKIASSVLPITSHPARGALSDNLPYIQWTRSAKTKFLLRFQTPIQKPSLMLLKKKEKKIFFILWPWLRLEYRNVLPAKSQPEFTTCLKHDTPFVLSCLPVSRRTSALYTSFGLVYGRRRKQGWADATASTWCDRSIFATRAIEETITKRC